LKLFRDWLASEVPASAKGYLFQPQQTLLSTHTGP
jgi:hypothetical protein